jgi:uncharacterized protein YbcV (DUF1398 family)
MNADVVNSLAKATLDGSLPFSQIISELVTQGVEYYHVDYVLKTFTFYSAAGATITSPLQFEGLPSISSSWDATSLKEVIIDSQKNGQKFRQFCDRAMAVGVQGYFVFIQGQRVIYMSRNGDQHIEWFPGVKPSNAVHYIHP